MIRAKETKDILEAIGLDPENITKEKAIETILSWKAQKSSKNTTVVVNVKDEMGFVTPHTFDTMSEAEDFVIDYYDASDKLQRMSMDDALYEIEEDLSNDGCGESFEIV